MTLKKTLLWLSMIFCLAVLAIAFYMQEAKGMLPCPACILQRYAFIGVLVFAGLGVATRRPSLGAGLALLCAVAGAGVAIYHLHAIANPSLSCGFDPLADKVNALAPARWWPQMFTAIGLCTTTYAPFLGVSFPMWSLLSFIGLLLVMVWVLLRRR